MRIRDHHCRMVRVAFHFLLAFAPVGTHTLLVRPLLPLHSGTPQPREPFREIPVKVHIRRPDRDAWVYVGRATVSLDTTTGHASQVGEPSLSARLPLLHEKEP